jgi:hypothetical protein
VNNAGIIVGGAGGPSLIGGDGSAGGVGAFLNGGTLTNSRTIAGGSGFRGGPAGAAVQFGTVAATLIVDPGARFNGQVVANAAAADVLMLAGTTAATLSGLGTSFINFRYHGAFTPVPVRAPDRIFVVPDRAGRPAGSDQIHTRA